MVVLALVVGAFSLMSHSWPSFLGNLFIGNLNYHFPEDVMFKHTLLVANGMVWLKVLYLALTFYMTLIFLMYFLFFINEFIRNEKCFENHCLLLPLTLWPLLALTKATSVYDFLYFLLII